MYYTIEGNRLLKILYVSGFLLGTLILNIGMKKGLFHSYEFLDYAGYISTLNEASYGHFFSYVLMIRIRQILLFIISILLFSPYITYCLVIFLFSFITGGFVSLLVMQFGWIGMFYGGLFLMPQVLFYGAMFYLAYIYIFRYRPREQRHWIRSSGYSNKLLKRKSVTDNRLFVAALCIIMFCVGCYCEGYINPGLLKLFLPI